MVGAEFEFELGWLSGQRNELSLLLLLMLGGGWCLGLKRVESR